MSKIKDIMLAAEETDSVEFEQAMNDYDMSKLCQIVFRKTEVNGKPALVNVR